MLSFSGQQIELWVTEFLWPFFRILALFTTAPVLNNAAFPVRAKVGLAFLMTVVIAPTATHETQAALFSSQGFNVLLQQLTIGAALGFAVTLAFAAVQMTGDLVGLQMGLGFAWFVDPQSSAEGPMVGSMLSLFATLIFLAFDGHLLLLSAIAGSFALVPVGPLVGTHIDWGKLLHAGGDIFALGLHAALPALAAVFLSNVALGVLTRAAPQLNLLAIGFPITLLLGLTTLWVTLPHWGSVVERTLRASLQLLL
jgi:flagellar biosynthesis protein FliR